jgi:oligosaccharide repeat unit polymerase
VAALTLAVPIAAVGALLAHRLIHHGRVGMTPLAGYAGAWITVIGLYSVDPFELDQVTNYTWALFAVSFMAFVGGYALARPLGIGAANGRRTSGFATTAPTPALARPLNRLWLVCLVFGAGLFMVYAYEIASIYGFSSSTLTALRVDLSLGPAPPGFYFFVFAEPLVPLSVILALLKPSYRNVYLAIGALAIMSLLATSGRANATFALLWAFSSFAIYQGSRLIRLRLILIAVASLIVAFAIFSFLGNTVGKTYQNSYLYGQFGDQPPIPAQLVVPYLYLESPLPTFSAIVRDTDSFALGRNSFRPVFQILAVFDHEISVPPHIQDFKLIPYPFNISTYLSPFYRDFGVVGVLFGPVTIGFFVGFLYSRWQVRRSPATLCLAGFASVVAISSVGDLPLLDLSRVLEFVAVAAMAALETRNVAERLHAGGGQATERFLRT